MVKKHKRPKKIYFKQIKTPQIFHNKKCKYIVSDFYLSPPPPQKIFIIPKIK